MKKVVIFAPTYLPGFKGGGPVQSINNIVENLSERFDFYIITSDRDKGDRVPYYNITSNKWIKRKNYNIFYSKHKSIKVIKQQLNKIKPDIVYLNTFFSWKDSIKIVMLKKIIKMNAQIIIAPRGEFDSGALSIKKKKKKLFINIYKLLKLDKNVTWHATTNKEYDNIKKIFPNAKKIVIAGNLTDNYEKLELKNRIKDRGILKLVFISRISEKKNLLMCFEILSQINEGSIIFSIYGPIENREYWSTCKKRIKELPDNIKVFYEGEIEHKRINDVLSENHFFFFPTLGENYGHVISEALVSGCPVIISTETPWNDLSKKRVGWDIPLNDKKKYIEIINKCVKMNQEDFQEMSIKAFEYAKNSSALQYNIDLTERMLISGGNDEILRKD